VLLADGTIRAFGTNVYGELGNGATATYQRTPVTVSGIANAVAVAAGGLYGNVTGGDKFSLALLSDGTIKAWGDNTYGQLGNGTTTASTIPVTVSGITNAVAIAAGPSHALALLSDGTIKAWGDNTYGQLGDGTTTSPRLTPVTVCNTGATAGTCDSNPLTNAVALAAGGTSWSDSSFALLSDGTIKAWGSNGNGKLGDGTTTTRTTPVTVCNTGAVAGTCDSNPLTGVAAIAPGQGQNHYRTRGHPVKIAANTE
jgi:alpha-tubulin suppressor-like RCC1 family protein